MEQPYACHQMDPAGPEFGPSVLVDQAVQLLGVSKRTVYYWIRDGRLRTFRTRCGSRRVLLSSIDNARSEIAVTRRSAPRVAANECLL